LDATNATNNGPKLKAHVFICTNERQNKASCAQKGSISLREELKKECLNLFGKEVRINESGCLGQCEKGIACVIYPDSKWLFFLKNDEESKEKILKIIKEKF
jgi:(2Fe-2S) ferredoxin